jgi:hypothetical protein
MLFFLLSTHKQCILSHLYCHVFLKTFYPGGIRTQVFTFLRRMRCPLCHAARARIQISNYYKIPWPDISISRPICPKVETVPLCRPRLHQGPSNTNRFHFFPFRKIFDFDILTKPITAKYIGK